MPSRQPPSAFLPVGAVGAGDFGPTNGRQSVIDNAGPNDVGHPGGTPTVVNPGDNIASKITTAGVGGTLWFPAGLHRITAEINPLTGQLWYLERGPLGTSADSAVIRGSAVLSSWVVDGSDWRHDGQTQNFGAPEAGHDNPLADVKENLFMDGVWMEHVADRASLAPGKVFFDNTNDRFYIRDNPAGNLMEAVKSGFGLRCHPTNTTTDVEIHGGVLEHFGNVGFQVSDPGTSWLVEDLESRWAGTAAMSFHHGDGNKDMTWRRCRAAFGGRYAWLGSTESPNNVEGLVFENFEWYGGNFGGFANRAGGMFGEGGCKYLNTSGAIFRECYGHDNDGAGFWGDFRNDNTLVEDGVFENNCSFNYFHERNQLGGEHRRCYIGEGGVDPGSTLLPVDRGLWLKGHSGGIWWAQSSEGELHHFLVEMGSDSRCWALKYRYGSVASGEPCQNNSIHHNRFRYGAVPLSAVSEREVVSVRDALAGWGAAPSADGDDSFGFMDFNEYEFANTSEDLFNMPSQGDPTRTFAEHQAAGYDVNGAVRVLS